jgi:hypothetical protein
MLEVNPFIADPKLPNIRGRGELSLSTTVLIAPPAASNPTGITRPTARGVGTAKPDGRAAVGPPIDREPRQRPDGKPARSDDRLGHAG